MSVKELKVSLACQRGTGKLGHLGLEEARHPNPGYLADNSKRAMF